MNGVRKKYDEEFKKNAVKLSYVSPKTISELCEDLGISDSMLYHWRQRYTSQGDKTQSATLESVLKKESVHRVHFHTREEARQAMFGYIEGFCNTKRVQKRLGYASPNQWFKEWYRRNAVGVA